MNNEELVEQIYKVLVERFGISEVFLKKYGKSRPNDINWKEFIKCAINSTEVSDLIIYCGYTNRSNFNYSISTKHKKVYLDKKGCTWKNYLLSLIKYKRCTACLVFKSYDEYYLDRHSVDKHRSVCLICEASTRSSLSRKAYLKAYTINNRHAILAYQKEYRQEHIVERYVAGIKYRAYKLQATPNWANQEAIKLIYATVPKGYHVDHIIPLQNPLVCGLHCEFNLQHLSAHDNLSKGNKYEP